MVEQKDDAKVEQVKVEQVKEQLGQNIKDMPLGELESWVVECGKLVSSLNPEQKNNRVLFSQYNDKLESLYFHDDDRRKSCVALIDGKITSNYLTMSKWLLIDKYDSISNNPLEDDVRKVLSWFDHIWKTSPQSANGLDRLEHEIWERKNNLNEIAEYHKQSHTQKDFLPTPQDDQKSLADDTEGNEIDFRVKGVYENALDYYQDAKNFIDSNPGEYIWGAERFRLIPHGQSEYEIINAPVVVPIRASDADIELFATESAYYMKDHEGEAKKEEIENRLTKIKTKLFQEIVAPDYLWSDYDTEQYQKDNGERDESLFGGVGEETDESIYLNDTEGNKIKDELDTGLTEPKRMILDELLNYEKEYFYPEPQTMRAMMDRAEYQFDEQDPERDAKATRYLIKTRCLEVSEHYNDNLAVF